jgi:hypothetical protein
VQDVLLAQRLGPVIQATSVQRGVEVLDGEQRRRGVEHERRGWPFACRDRLAAASDDQHGPAWCVQLFARARCPARPAAKRGYEEIPEVPDASARATLQVLVAVESAASARW